jgi:hypothetical protein
MKVHDAGLKGVNVPRISKKRIAPKFTLDTFGAPVALPVTLR